MEACLALIYPYDLPYFIGFTNRDQWLFFFCLHDVKYPKDT